MLRALNRLAARPETRPRTPLLLPVRGRKTRHDPPAKSKVGRVQTPPAVDPAEFFVLTERYRQYRETVRALRCVCLCVWRADALREGPGPRVGADSKPVLPRLEFTLEVRRKLHEARAGVLAERKAQQAITEHRELMAWNRDENRRMQELRCERRGTGWAGLGSSVAPLTLGVLPLAG